MLKHDLFTTKQALFTTKHALFMSKHALFMSKHALFTIKHQEHCVRSLTSALLYLDLYQYVGTLLSIYTA
jgi:hypothetical protein